MNGINNLLIEDYPVLYILGGENNFRSVLNLNFCANSVEIKNPTRQSRVFY